MPRLHISLPTNNAGGDLPRAGQLVSPAWLFAQLRALHTASPPATSATPTRPWRLLEVGCLQHDDFLAGHIPSARYLDTHRLEEGPFWNKVPDAALLAVLLDLGICHDTTVVVYGRSILAAARAAHLLLYAGVSDVRLLDGGMQAWQRHGGPCESGEAAACNPASAFGAPFPGCPQFLMNRHHAAALLTRPDGALVSIRSWDEFTGKISGYPYIAIAGDIAGALWGRAGHGGDVHSMSDFQKPDGTMKPAADIARFWQQNGIVSSQYIGFYCGTGWRASLAFFYAWVMGWECISVYDGGWIEWSANAIASEMLSHNHLASIEQP